MKYEIKIIFYLAVSLSCRVHFGTGQPNRITFQNISPFISINENATVQSDQGIFSFSATSNSPTQNVLNVSCDSLFPQDACDTFKIRATSASTANWIGFLYLAKALDYSQIRGYTLQLTASDGQVTQSQPITINVLATRYRPPVFLASYVTEIQERPAASDQPIFTFEARAPDSATAGFPVRYRIRSGSSSSYFNLNEITGILTNRQPLTSTQPIFSGGMTNLQIEAAYLIGNVPSWDNSSTSSVVNATIYTSGSNVYQPTFDKVSYNGSVKETAIPGTFVDSIFMTVTDSDNTPTAASFELFLDKDVDKFDVNPKSGFKLTEARISVINNNFFSYNDGPRQYSFNVTARESKSTERKFSKALVTVNLVQANRYAPTFFQNPYNVSIPESAPGGTTVVQVKAWDRDVGPIFGNESIKYRIAQGPAALFRMTEDGLITVAPCRTPGVYRCLDYEFQDFRSLRLVVFAMDVLGEGLTSSATVIINLENENDNPPIFSQQSYRGFIDDNSTVLTIAPTPIQALDADNDRITYSIKDGNVNNLWQINSSNGVLTPIRPIRFTDAPNGIFNLIIQAGDGLPAHDNLVYLNITVKPINRYSPIFTMPSYNTNISRTTAPGTTVVRVTANDQDPPGTPGGTVSYRIIAGDLDVFGIDPSSGAITLKAPLNQGSPGKYVLQVEASDQGEFPKKSTVQVEVNILSSDLFIQSQDVVIRDDTPLFNIVITLVASTTAQNPVFSYLFVEPKYGFDVNLNKITNFTDEDRIMFLMNQRNGSVTVNKPLNYERIPIWRSSVQVVMVSPGIPLTATSSITIRLLPTNKRPPIFNAPWSSISPFYNLSLDQGNIPQPDNVATYSAASPNQSLSVTYELKDPNQYFKLISPASGIIRQLKPIEDLKANYSFLLLARDNGDPSLTSTAVIYVNVNPTNMYSPEFQKEIYNVTIWENATEGSVVTQVQATDRDTGNYGQIVYIIDPAVSSTFSIDDSTGFITVKPGAQFDAAKRPYIQFFVTAADSPGEKSKSRFTNCIVQVTILDVNDHAPVFRSGDYFVQVLDNLAVGSKVVTLEATDGDVGNNGKITYSIISGNDQGVFVMQPDGTISLSESLIGKPNTFTLNASAADQGTPPKSGYCNVRINVLPSCGSICNPNWLKPNSLSTTVNILESAPLGTLIQQLVANNYVNQSSSINFTFYKSTYENFAINTISQNMANITLVKQLDYGKNRIYTLQVEASDANIPGSSSVIYVIVNVLRAFNPQFPFDNKTFCAVPIALTIPITTQVNSVITKVVAENKYPNEDVVYSLKGVSGSAVPFMIKNRSGEIVFTNNPNVSGVYSMTVKAKYNPESNQNVNLCNGFDQSNVSISITVLDVFPTYTSNPINYCIDNSLESDSDLLQLNNFLVNYNLGLIIYNTDTDNDYLNLYSNGNITLKKSASEIKVSQVLHVISRYAQRPSSVTDFNVVGYPVNRETDLTLITLNERLNDFQSTGRQNFLKTMSSYGFVCIVDATYHSTDQGILDTTMTDVFVYVISNSGNSRPILPLDLDRTLGTVAQRSSANIVGITGAVSKWDGFNYDPVAIAIGLIMGLLLLCFLFFLCCCLWPFIAECMSSGEKEPFLARSMMGGIASQEWINPRIQEQEEHVKMDVTDADVEGPAAKTQLKRIRHNLDDADILQDESLRYEARQTDDIDGMMSNESLQPVVPTGHVHIEASLAPSRSASAMETLDVRRSGNASQSVTETNLRESYERGDDRQERQFATYANRDDMDGAQSSRGTIRRSEARHSPDDSEGEGPVRLNEAGNTGSKIGATLIKAEPVGGLTQVQSIISGNDLAFDDDDRDNLGSYDYPNYGAGGTFVTSPSRSNMAYSNEVFFSALRPASNYDDRGSTLANYPRGHNNNSNDLMLNPVSGVTREEMDFMETYEETKFI